MNTDQVVETAPAVLCQPCSQAELQWCARWMDEHGDPADWSTGTHEAYENTRLLMWSGGAA